MDNTNLKMYRKEIRMLTIEVYQVNEKQQLIDFDPLSATIKIINNETDRTALDETAAGISGNQVYYLLDSSTLTVGEFKVIWKMAKGSETFYHKTYLEVEEI